jgi:tetratricopeptide (TPR) repeat protein
MRTALILSAALSLLLLGAADLLAASPEAIRRNNFGADLVKQGKLEDALKDFQRAVEIDPDYAAAQLNLAYTYDRLGRADEAMAAYQKAIALEPGNGYAHNNLGTIYDKKGRYAEAVEAYAKALALDPANAIFQQNLENAKRSQATIEERDAQFAAAHKQVEARPQDPEAAYDLGRLYAAYARPDQAIEWLTKAVELGYNDLRGMRDDPALAGLRNDPRFIALTQKQ